MTENPPATIEPETFTVRRTIRIDATADAVWRAITEPALISKWFGRAEFDGFAVGARGTLSWPDNSSDLVRIEAIEQPHSVSYRWTASPAKAGETDLDALPTTIFTFTLEPLAGATQLTVVETGFEGVADPAAALEDHRGGWNFELDKLVALLEGAG